MYVTKEGGGGGVKRDFGKKMGSRIMRFQTNIGYAIRRNGMGYVSNVKYKKLMHCHCGNNNRAPRWTFTDPCKPEVRLGVREESASPAWLPAPAMNARDTTKEKIGKDWD